MKFRNKRRLVKINFIDPRPDTKFNMLLTYKNTKQIANSARFVRFAKTYSLHCNQFHSMQHIAVWLDYSTKIFLGQFINLAHVQSYNSGCSFLTLQ